MVSFEKMFTMGKIAIQIKSGMKEWRDFSKGLGNLQLKLPYNNLQINELFLAKGKLIVKMKYE